MSSIDRRIVEMRFDNKQFEEGTRQSINSLDRLKKALDLDEPGKQLEKLQEIGRNFTLSSIEESVDNIANKFSLLGVVGFTVFNNLTNSLMDFGKKLFSSTLGQILTGGKQRALNIEQAKFQFKGLGMDIEATMASALAAVKGTAYGLDEAAKVAGQLGATGMRAGEEMTAVLTGISGVAAMTNSSYEDIGNIFTTIAGNGRLMGQQLLQLGSRGINAAAILGKALNKTEAEVRSMVSKGKIDFLTFANAMNDAFGEHATSANELYTGSLSNVRAALSRLGASFQTFRLEAMTDVFNALIPVIDGIHDALSPVIALFGENIMKTSGGIVKVLKSLDFHGLKITTIGLVAVFKELTKILIPIKEAFKEVFPPALTKEFYKFSTAFWSMTNKFKIGEKTLTLIKDIFVGIFSVLKFGIDIVKTSINLFAALLGFAAPSGGGLFSIILNITAGIGRFLTNLTEAIRGANIFADVIDNLKKRIGGSDFNPFEKIVSFIKGMGSVVVGFFKTIINGISELMDAISFEKTFQAINTGLFAGVLVAIQHFFDTFSNFVMTGGGTFSKLNQLFFRFRNILDVYQNTLKAKVLLQIAFAIAVLAASLTVLSMIDPDKLMNAIMAISVLFAELTISLGLLSKISIGTGLLSFGKILVGITGISVAILILSFAMKNLASLDWAGVGKGLVGVIGLTTALSIAAKALSIKKATFIKGATGFIFLATAILILTEAVKRLGGLDTKVLLLGLTAVAVLLAELAIFMKATSFSGMSIASSIAILSMAAALVVLSEAVKRLGNLDLPSLAKGLGGIAVLLAELVIFMKMATGVKGALSTAVALTIISASLLIFANAVNELGRLDLVTLGKGLGAIAAGLFIIVVAMKFMQGSLPGAAALLVTAAALAIFVPVLKMLGNMSLEQIGIGLLGLAGIFIVLGVAGLVLAPVVPVILSLAASIALLGIGVLAIGAGVLTLATGLGALAVSGAAAATSLVVVVTALASTIPVIFTKIGEGIIAFATAIGEGASAIGVAISKVLDVVIGIIQEYIGPIVDTFIMLLDTLLTKLTEYIPELVDKAYELIEAFITAIVEKIPDFVQLGKDIVLGLIEGIKESIKDLVVEGWNLAGRFLNAVREKFDSNSPSKEMIKEGVNAVTGLIKGVTETTPEAEKAGATLASKTLKSVRETSAKVSVKEGQYMVDQLVIGMVSKEPDAKEASKFLAQAIANGLIKEEPIFKGIGDTQATKFLEGMTEKQIIDNAWAAGVEVSSSAWQGAKTTAEKMSAAGTAAGQAYINGLNKAAQEAKALADTITDRAASGYYSKQLSQEKKDIANGLAYGLNELSQLTDAEAEKYWAVGAGKMGKNVVETMREVGNGMAEGIKEGSKTAEEAMSESTKKVVKINRDLLRIQSPSKVFKEIGEYTMAGFAEGIIEFGEGVVTKAGKIGKDTISVLKESMLNVYDLVSGDLDLSPTIRPVLDLTNVQNGSKLVSSILDGYKVDPSYAIKTASLVNSKENGNTIVNPGTNETTYSFVQNNYSPKALSRLDIYRQTKNQFSALKGLVNS